MTPRDVQTTKSDRNTMNVLTTWRQEFDQYLASFVAMNYPETMPGKQINDIIVYVLRGKGKRVRPLMSMLAAEACGGPHEKALPAGLAVELVHTYSLVHDDLPCMDDDDLRRGEPAAHRAFDEARALLAGDGLLTDAFAFLSSHMTNMIPKVELPPLTRLRLIEELSRASGSDGMVLGQALDLYWTGRGGASQNDLDQVHRRKTGYLIGAACAMGALCAGASETTVDELREFGLLIGLAFQITDDLLDDSAAIGKTAGKDRDSGKLTYLATMTAAEAQAAAASCTAKATALARKACGTRATELIAFAEMLLSRNS